MSKYVEPKEGLNAFTCPYCSSYSQQNWFNLHTVPQGNSGYTVFSEAKFSQCVVCNKYTVWYKFSIPVSGAPSSRPLITSVFMMILPKESPAPIPSEDMPEDVKMIYEEARNILNDSPRGAAALLRLGVQNLMPHLSQKGDNINDDIGELVKNGLDPIIQKALDSLRVIGNNAVHPGQIDLQDDTETANKLFTLLNTIIELTITRKKFIDSIYDELPDSDKKAIEKRDNKKKEL